MVFDRWRGAVVLVVFQPDGLGIIKLWKFELANAGEKHRCSCELDKIALCDLVYFLQFTDVSVKVRRVGWTRG